MYFNKLTNSILKYSLPFLLIMGAGCSRILVRTDAPSPCSPTPQGCVCPYNKDPVPYPGCSTYFSYPPAQIIPFLERYSK
jgi:hypothetical protein